MKAYEKKKLFQKFCRDQVKAGLINDAEGKWIRANDTGGEYKNMHRDMRAGYKIR